MTGQAHYQEAERRLEQAHTADAGPFADYLVAKAQVHATLALAAATLVSAPCDSKAWSEFAKAVLS